MNSRMPTRVAVTCCAFMLTFFGVPSSVQASLPTPKTAVFIGDSYSEGQGAGSPTKRFTTLTAQAMGWSEINLASGGTGYLAQCWVKGKLHPNYSTVMKSISTQPDFVVVSGGRNDLWNAKTAAAIPAFFTALHAKFPNAQLIVTSPIWDARRLSPAKMNLIKSAVQAASIANGVTYVDLREPLAGHYEYLTKDWIHPNARGHAAIATALIQGLQNTVAR